MTATTEAPIMLTGIPKDAVILVGDAEFGQILLLPLDRIPDGHTLKNLIPLDECLPGVGGAKSLVIDVARHGMVVDQITGRQDVLRDQFDAENIRLLTDCVRERRMDEKREQDLRVKHEQDLRELESRRDERQRLCRMLFPVHRTVEHDPKREQDQSRQQAEQRYRQAREREEHLLLESASEQARTIAGLQARVAALEKMLAVKEGKSVK